MVRESLSAAALVVVVVVVVVVAAASGALTPAFAPTLACACECVQYTVLA